MEEETFEKELRQLLNKYSAENASNTPDFVLAHFVMASLNAFNETTLKRDTWWDNRSLKWDR